MKKSIAASVIGALFVYPALRWLDNIESFTPYITPVLDWLHYPGVKNGVGLIFIVVSFVIGCLISTAILSRVEDDTESVKQKPEGNEEERHKWLSSYYMSLDHNPEFVRTYKSDTIDNIHWSWSWTTDLGSESGYRPINLTARCPLCKVVLEYNGDCKLFLTCPNDDCKWTVDYKKLSGLDTTKSRALREIDRKVYTAEYKAS